MRKVGKANDKITNKKQIKSVTNTVCKYEIL